MKVSLALEQGLDCRKNGVYIGFWTETFDAGFPGLLFQLLGGIGGYHEDGCFGMLFG